MDLTRFSGYKFRSSSDKGACRSIAPKARNELKSALPIVRVHYFVRGGFVGHRSRAKFKASLPSSSGRVARFLGGSNRGCAASEAARVGVESTKKPTPDVVVFET
ncbi:hypothetical protein TNCV_4293411 [Trichonephila clavipes]|uniref:Uncharacterized protein n=1 Tax=Trichonephila clavipes TaxID=2585209 RepID=A0A8X6RMN0_TRICX|nr:hypothetical protein TNCV_4293411 [Trichonephila clavipes]